MGYPDADEIDAQIGEHVEEAPKVAATDGGVTPAEFGADDCDDDRPEDCVCEESLRTPSC